MTVNKEEKLQFLIEELWERQGSLHKLDESTNLYSLGLDSLDITELRLLYEEKTGIMTYDTGDVIVTVGDLLKSLP